MDIKGRITNIQRCSVHDGPGIRTTVFLKGCNMNCKWCHNPETISFEKEMLFYPDRCIGCGNCEDGCFADAKVPCGRDVTVAEVAAEVLQDRPYYGADGGVTITGGEPMCQPAFTKALLTTLKQQGIHVAIESNMSLPYEKIQPILQECDLVMADMKLWDNGLHKKYTDIDNSNIIANFEKLQALSIPLIVRTPVMAGINDTENEIAHIAQFLSRLPSLLYYELLPYHPLGLSKGVDNQMRFETPTKEALHQLALIAGKYCKQVWVSGVPVIGGKVC